VYYKEEIAGIDAFKSDLGNDTSGSVGCRSGLGGVLKRVAEDPMYDE